MGSKLGVGALAFCLFEETVDYARHDERDFLSTVTAGLSCSGIYSLLGKARRRGLFLHDQNDSLTLNSHLQPVMMCTLPREQPNSG